MTKTVIFFTAGNQATAPEIAAIEQLSTVAEPSLIVKVRSAIVSNEYGSLEEADLLAGTIPAAYLDEEDEPIYPEIDITNPPLIVGNSQAVVSSESDLIAVPVAVGAAAAADYDVSFTIVDGVITAMTLTAS